MNNKNVRRGYVDTDKYEFSPKSLETLKKAQKEIHWLLDRGYPIKNAVTFVGNHYMLSNRQRIALTRATSSTICIKQRKDKQTSFCDNQTVNIDGFNLIITLEVALSQSTLIKCMDTTIRDLAGLRGTYRLIDKTDMAIHMIGEKLESMKISKAVFYLDSPVSNTGRLKTRINELLSRYNYDISVELINNVDKVLKEKSYVITTDAIILNECVSWINLANDLISNIPNINYIDLSNNE